MKFFKKTLYVASAIAFIMVIHACTDNFSSLNTPKTELVEINPGFLFTNAQRAEFRAQGTNAYWHMYARLMGGWPQHIGETAPGNYLPFQYSQHRRNDNNAWNGGYTNILRSLHHAELQLLRIGEDDESNPQIRTRLAQVRILQVQTWERMTGAFGDIPFSEAMKGLELNTSPRYDRQQDIYPVLLGQLEESITRLTEGDLTLGSADLFYRGDVDKWRRYGNTLLLRTAMRIRYADPSTAQMIVTQQMGRPLISSHEHSAKVRTDGGDGNAWFLHGMHHAMRQGFLHGLNQTLITVLQDYNDPRLVSIAEPLAESKAIFAVTGDPNDLVYRGSLNNMTLDYINSIGPADISDPAHHIWREEGGYNPPMQALTYANSLFLQAEAALLGWGADRSEAEGYYQDAIRASMEMEPYSIDVTPAQIDAYIAQHGTLSANDDEALEQIMTQKWINHFDNYYELYFEWRRTSYPRLYPGSGGRGETNNAIPRRAHYHQEEASLNSENYNEAIQRLGGENNYMGKMWIDANPHNGQTVTY